ncbi:MAG TPA: hypothetical protein IAB62_13840 [Candidatus Coprocola pullicola]|nr:hypothetical protein [Candidatus Coprocola pullicola]
MIDGISEICQAMKKGENVSNMAAKLEPKLKRFCDMRDKVPFGTKYSLYYEDALYDISPSIKNYWNTIYNKFESTYDKYEALLKFVNVRERCLGVSHIESINILIKCGWTPADIMAAYIHNRVDASTLLLSPDVAYKAANDDFDTALQLLEGKNYDVFFPFYDKSYQIYRQFEWIDFLYCFLGYNDNTFLQKAHKSKRLRKYCEKILEKLSHSAATNNFINRSNYPDFSIFENISLQQKHLMRSAGAQGLLKGNENNPYYVMSFHLTDEALGCGAALCFEPMNKSPEYSDETVKAYGIYFYRFEHLYLSDYIPESRRYTPENMPEEFVKKAYHAFSMAAGIMK